MQTNENKKTVRNFALSSQRKQKMLVPLIFTTLYQPVRTFVCG